MLLKKNNITKIIPQQPPFVMVDNLLKANEQGFESTFIVNEDNIFFSENKLQEPALIENIAQTVAAGFGFIDKQTGGKPKIGFIGSVAKLKLHNLPDLGDLIKTKVVLLHQFENIHLVKGENYANGALLVECEMKIVVQQ